METVQVREEEAGDSTEPALPGDSCPSPGGPVTVVYSATAPIHEVVCLLVQQYLPTLCQVLGRQGKKRQSHPAFTSSLPGMRVEGGPAGQIIQNKQNE